MTRHGDRWKAKITHQGVEHFLGYFDDEIVAALTRDAKAKELHGEFAYLNFPDGPPPGYENWTQKRWKRGCVDAATAPVGPTPAVQPLVGAGRRACPLRK